MTLKYAGACLALKDGMPQASRVLAAESGGLAAVSISGLSHVFLLPLELPEAHDMLLLYH